MTSQKCPGKINFPLIFATSAAAGGSSFLFGYDTGVINSPAEFIQAWIQNESYPSVHGGTIDQKSVNAIWSWIVAIFAIGGMFGSVLCGLAADKFGRKGAMLLNNIIAIIAAILMGISKPINNYILLFVGRFLLGFNCGLNTGLAPMYLTEIAPLHLRGTLGSVNQLVIVTAIFVSQVLGLPQLLGTADLWPVLLGLTALPAIWQLTTLPFCPESPKYLLVIKLNEAEAAAALTRLRRNADITAEMNALIEETKMASTSPSVSFSDMFTTPWLLWGLIISVVMMFSQQCSGIVVALYYSTILFRDGAHMSQEMAAGATLGIGITMVIITVISMATVDRFGRRILMLFGMAGMAIMSICLVITLHILAIGSGDNRSAAYVSIALVYLFVVFFAIGPGNIPWFFVSELFEHSARGKANTLAVLMNWFANFVIGVSFLPWKDAVHEFSFLLYLGFLLIFGMFIYFFAPETKGRKYNEIANELQQKTPKFFASFFRRRQ